METFSNWLDNKIPPWAAYNAFISGCLIALDKQPGVHPVGVRETWRQIFDKIVLKLTGPESIMVCKDDQLYAALKAGINGAVHWVQAILEENPTTKDWVFLPVDAENAFNEINRTVMLWTVCHL